MLQLHLPVSIYVTIRYYGTKTHTHTHRRTCIRIKGYHCHCIELATNSGITVQSVVESIQRNGKLKRYTATLAARLHSFQPTSNLTILVGSVAATEEGRENHHPPLPTVTGIVSATLSREVLVPRRSTNVFTSHAFLYIFHRTIRKASGEIKATKGRRRGGGGGRSG